MKLLLTILILSFLMLSCTNRQKSADAFQRKYASFDADSACYTIDSDSSRSVKNASPVTYPVNSSSISSHNNTSEDNMRGFDPTSEDDMEDNGMSRYMENTDEEGWD